MDENFKILGRRVKFLRMERGISQTQMAKMLGLSQTNLSNMESGRTTITTQNLFKMRDILECTMAEFFVDFDNGKEKEAIATQKEIELEDALQLLKLLKGLNVRGL